MISVSDLPVKKQIGVSDTRDQYPHYFWKKNLNVYLRHPCVLPFTFTANI